MKKIFYSIFILAVFILINQCAGYKPIFSTTNLQFKIAEHEIKGNKLLGNKLYSRLHILSKSKNNEQNIRNITLILNVKKTKSATSKDSSGKILEYKINLNTQVIVNNYLNDDQLLNHNFDYTSSYKVQDQYFDTIKYENKTQDDMINKTYQDLLIKLSEKIGNDN